MAKGKKEKESAATIANREFSKETGIANPLTMQYMKKLEAKISELEERIEKLVKK